MNANDKQKHVLPASPVIRANPNCPSTRSLHIDDRFEE